MIKKSTFLFSILFGLYTVIILAQERPPIQKYEPHEYFGENQNWAVTQDVDQHIFVANNKGLLEFNGARWQLYNSPNETTMRSVLAIGNRVYSGCYMEFGYWEKDGFGVMQYTSLSKKLNEPLKEDEEFWNIIQLEGGILFQSLDRIYIYNVNDGDFKIINSEHRIVKMYLVDNDVYFQRDSKGIFKLESGRDVLVSNHPLIVSNRIINIFSNKGILLFQTQDNGFFEFNDNNLLPWSNPTNNIIKDYSVYNSIELKNKSIVLGTISNGVIVLDSKGEIKHKINQDTGLSNNTVLSLFEDKTQNIWLGLDNGINCLNIQSAFKVYNDKQGDLGSVYSSIKHNDYLYLGTNQGLFYKPLDTDLKFKFIEGTQGQVWALKVIDNVLFCGHDSGTFIIDKESSQLISNVQGAWDFKQFPNNPNLILQGNYDGLVILEKKEGAWEFKNKINGYNNSSRFYEFIDSRRVLVNHEYKGIYDIKLDENLTNTLEVTVDTLKKSSGSSLIRFNDDLLYAYKGGIFKYDFGEKSFFKDSILSSIFKKEDYSSGKLVVDKDNDRTWFFTDSSIGYIGKGNLTNKPKITTIALPVNLRNTLSGNENILHLKNDVYLLGTSTGYITLDVNKVQPKDYKVNLDLVTSKTSKDDNLLNFVNLNQEASFKNTENNIEFSYSISEYDKYFNPEFQYKLEGFYDFWSHWSTNSKVVFENLPYGDYVFKVRGKLNNTLTTNEAPFVFKIEKPWYLSNTMVAVYALIFLLFSLMMHNIYKQYYKKQRIKLIEKANKEIELKELENKQQIMSFNNQRLKQDIDNKNRELAISTMSLIKKNEFLNTIKVELNKVENKTNVKSVLRLIDRNLNNTDDWKLFEEAFNNADKDFLKKIKTKHESLTPNDLKLCAYLRLNLSSKEIAPLLNISPRSVEVKRYRLRKKMNLPHEASLTNYILEM